MRRKMMTFSAALVLLVSAGIFTAKEMAPANELAQRNAKALANGEPNVSVGKVCVEVRGHFCIKDVEANYAVWGYEYTADPDEPYDDNPYH